MVSANGSGDKQAIAFEVQKETLEEMGKVEQAIAAALEHLDLIIEPLHKAAVVAMEKVMGDFFQPHYLHSAYLRPIYLLTNPAIHYPF